MIIDFTKDSSGDVVSISDIHKVLLKGPGKDDTVLYKASNSKILGPEDFLEYGIDFIPTKYKFNSTFPLDLLSKSNKELLGGNSEELERLGNIIFPTSNNEDLDSSISYFGSISVSDQVLILVRCPEGYNNVEFYQDDSVCITVRFGGEKSVDTGLFVELPKCKYEVDSSKIVWLVLGQDGLVKDINLSYRAWNDSNNKFRNLNQSVLRNDEFYRFLCDPEVIEKVPGGNLWFDRNSGTIIGTKEVPNTNTPILNNKLLSISKSNEYSPYVAYPKGAIVKWEGKDWVSLVDNNLGEQFVQLSERWILKSKLTGIIQKYLTIIISSNDNTGYGSISETSLAYEENVRYGLKFNIFLNPGVVFRGIWPTVTPQFNQWEYTRRYLSEADKADLRTRELIDNGAPTSPYFIKLTGSGYSGFSVELLPLSGNITYKEGNEFKVNTQGEFINAFYREVVGLWRQSVVVDVERVDIPIRLYYRYKGDIHNITETLTGPFEGRPVTSDNLKFKNLSGVGGKTTTILSMDYGTFKYKIGLKLGSRYSLNNTRYYHLESLRSGITKEEATEIDIEGHVFEPTLKDIDELTRELGVPVSYIPVSVSQQDNTINIEDELKKNGAPVFIFDIIDKNIKIKLDATNADSSVFFDQDYSVSYMEVEVTGGNTTTNVAVFCITIGMDITIRNSSGVILGKIENVIGNTTKTLDSGLVVKLDSDLWGSPYDPFTIYLSNITEDLTIEFSYK